MKPLQRLQSCLSEGERRAVILAMFMSLIAAGCGESGSSGISNPEDNLTESVSNSPVTDDPAFSGKIVIKFKEGTDVRLRADEETGPFVSLSRQTDVQTVNAVIRARLPQDGLAARVSRVTDTPEEKVTAQRLWWERRGVKLHDWNLAYYVDVPSEENARTMVKMLSADASVEYAEILPRFYISNVVTTPDLSGGQGYLKAASGGGLGVEDAWAKLDGLFPDTKLRGQMVSIVDNELDWNFDHEILPIDETMDYIWGVGWFGLTIEDGKGVPGNIEHGTAAVSIMTAFGEDVGKAMKGIASGAKQGVASMAFPMLGWVGDPVGEYGTVGAVVTIEVQQRGISTSPTKGCNVTDGVMGSAITGCVPIESNKFIHDVISDSSASGNVVVEGAGNGSVNLDNDSLAAPEEGMEEFSYFSAPENDSGAILVGASLGKDRRKAAWSNCGSRVDVFAWGAGVVAAGYGDYGVGYSIEIKTTDGSKVKCFLAEGVPGYDAASNDVANKTKFAEYVSWKYPEFQGLAITYKIALSCSDGTFFYDKNPATPELDKTDHNKWYTQRFGGTSAATAQVGGLAALVQSYMRKYVSELGYEPKTFYLDGRQIREILKSSGQAAVYGSTPGDPNPNCSIGVQPDMAKAITLAEQYIKDHPLHVVPLSVNSVSGIRYDMDGDGHADMISFSRDRKWYVDLSSAADIGPDKNDFGSWDLVLSTPSPAGGEGGGEGDEGEGAILFPAVHDYNSDGRADLALYDSTNGKWYIRFTTSLNTPSPQPSPTGGEGGLPSGGQGEGDEGEGVITWDKVIDYSQDSAWEKFSRPVPGDYDGDHWLDLALQTPDGRVVIDFGGFTEVNFVPQQGENPSHFEYPDNFGEIDKDIKYLTDAQLAEAPGWAWLVVMETWAPLGLFQGEAFLITKAPDGISKANYIYRGGGFDITEVFKAYPTSKYLAQFGDNDSFFVIGNYDYPSDVDQFGFKKPNGEWSYMQNNHGGSSWANDPQISPPPQDFGGVDCRPAPADYDGDGKADRAVLCGDGTWKIHYSAGEAVLTEVHQGGALDPLPAYVYSGGVKYQDQAAMFEYYKTLLNCGDAPCTASSSIHDVDPPIGPYFPQCLKSLAQTPAHCWGR